MYLKWDQIKTLDFSSDNIENLYDKGFLFGRIDKGILDQTRSIRIDLHNFELSSENRRILRKTENIKLQKNSIPFPFYHWSIGKLAKDFYDTKFSEKTMSANKIKEIMTDEQKTNFNTLLVYSDNEVAGYCICYESTHIFHYCYPFYDHFCSSKNMGMGMMLKAILWAKGNGKKYFYLGSAQRPSDIYKLQFEGLEWFDGKMWKSDIDQLKEILRNI